MRAKSRKLTTYQIGLLQAQAQRRFRQFVADQLSPYELTMMEWILLGYIFDCEQESGVRTGAVADELDVEPSLITNMINKLEGRQFVERLPDPQDARAKRVKLKPKGEKTVRSVETSLNTEIANWTDGVSKRQLAYYLRVLRKLADK